MSETALVVGEADLRPLLQSPSGMDSAIDVIEQATVDFYRGQVREKNIADQTAGPGTPNLVQIHFSADDTLVSGFQVFAETRGGGPTLPNSRFVALLDPATRQLIGLVDYTSLSPLRVGASTGVGCRYLAPGGARTVGILGSGKQARAQLQAIQRTVPTLERARVYSPTAAHREAFAREVTDWLDLPVEAVATAEAATRDADIVGLANDSREPVLDPTWIKSGATVVSISSNQYSASIVEGRRIVSTTWDSLATREPYTARIKAGAFSETDVAAELGALIVGEAQGRQSPGDTVVFELTRLNIWAVTTAYWALQWARQQGVGTPITLSGA